MSTVEIIDREALPEDAQHYLEQVIRFYTEADFERVVIGYEGGYYAEFTALNGKPFDVLLAYRATP